MKKNDRIKVETEAGKTIEVTVTSMDANSIWVLVGEGPHSIKCKLEPTGNKRAYAGSVMGRELIYHKSVDELRAELADSARKADSRRWK